MYEARRQRSSWARIKLSIVRKVMSISYRFPIRCSTLFCCPSLLFELTSFLTYFLSFSSSAILLSRFKISTYVLFRFSQEESESSHKIFAIYFRISISVLILQAVLWLLFSSLRPLSFQLGQSAHSAVSSPTNSILSLQFYLSTTFSKLILQNVTTFKIEFSRFFYKVLTLYFGITVVSFHLKRLPLAP